MNKERNHTTASAECIPCESKRAAVCGLLETRPPLLFVYRVGAPLMASHPLWMDRWPIAVMCCSSRSCVFHFFHGELRHFVHHFVTTHGIKTRQTHLVSPVTTNTNRVPLWYISLFITLADGKANCLDTFPHTYFTFMIKGVLALIVLDWILPSH